MVGLREAVERSEHGRCFPQWREERSHASPLSLELYIRAVAKMRGKGCSDVNSCDGWKGRYRLDLRV